MNEYLKELNQLAGDLYECFEVEAITKNNDNVFVEYTRNQSINYSTNSFISKLVKQLANQGNNHQ